MLKTPEDIEWMNVDRTKIIGGSDMAGILGYSKWSSPEIVMKQKLLGEEVEMNDKMFWGLRLEAAVADVYDELYCGEAFDQRGEASLFNPPKDKCQVFHPDHPWLVGSPDRLILNKLSRKIIGGLEIKTIGFFSKKSWKDGVPMYYQTQAQVYMMIFGLDEWEFFVLHGGQAHFHVVLPENPFMQEEILEKGQAFYKAMAKGIVGGEDYEQAMAHYYGAVGGGENEQEGINSRPMGKI